jgi:hypothetical protein
LQLPARADLVAVNGDVSMTGCVESIAAHTIAPARSARLPMRVCVALTLAVAADLGVAEEGRSGFDPCYRVEDTSRPGCLGYNPYYVPPGGNQQLGFPPGATGSPQYDEWVRRARARASSR